MHKFNLADCLDGSLRHDWIDDVRVLSVKRVKGGVRFREECDQYFAEELTPDEVETFITKLREVLASPEPSE
jgi:hypothetical protein